MKNQIKADLSLLFVTLIWGASFTLMKNVLDYMPSFAYLSLRFIIAAVVLAVLFHKKIGKLDKKAFGYGCIIGALLFAGMALQVTGLYFTTASNSAFITGLNVIMVPAISVILLKKKPDKRSIIGVFIALLGLFFLAGGLNFSFNLGDFLTLLCAVCFAFQIILIDRFTREYSPELLSFLQIAVAAILYLGVWVFVDFEPVVLGPTVIYTLLITGVLGTAFAFTVQTAAQKHTSPTHTALILTAEPVFGAIFALFIPNLQGLVETLRAPTIAGCILILMGMLISEI